LATRKDLERRQRRWADAAGVAYDARGFVRRLEDNLRTPRRLSPGLGDSGRSRRPPRSC